MAALKALDKRVVARLISSGDLEQRALEPMLAEYTGDIPLSEFLVAKGAVTGKAACRALAEVNGMRFIELGRVRPAPEAVKLLPAEQAWRLEAIPLAREGGKVVIAIADPNNVFAADEVRLKSRCTVEAVVAEREELHAALEIAYGLPPERGSSSQNVTTPSRGQIASTPAPAERSMHDSPTQVPLTPFGATTAREESSESDVHRDHQRRMRDLRSSGEVPVDIARAETAFEDYSNETASEVESGRILRGAYDDPPEPQAAPGAESVEPGAEKIARLLRDVAGQRVDELELTPTENGVRVRARRRGLWEPLEDFPASDFPAAVDYLRHMAGLDRTPRDVAEEHHFLLKCGAVEYFCHLFVEPSADGPRVVVRYLEGVPLLGDPFSGVGLPHKEGKKLNARLMRRGGGVMFISATHIRTLQHFYASLVCKLTQEGKRDVLSLERPPMRRIPGATSINCPTEEVLLASLANASFMNPDVVAVSSVENGTVMNYVLDVALQGTAVLACFQAPDSDTAQGCFRAAKFDPMNVVRGVAAHLHLEEAPRLCQSCMTPIEDRSGLPEWAQALEAEFYQAQGCKDCGGTGYRGTVYLSELYEPDSDAADGSFRTVLARDHDLTARCLGGELDPRECSR